MPCWEAQYIIVIASKTGWSEDYIRWQLPLARGLAYYHAARLLDGEDCRWPNARSKAADTSTLRDRIRRAVAIFTTGNT